jgi:hypothetical protein
LKWRTVFKHEFLSETLPCKVSNWNQPIENIIGWNTYLLLGKNNL